MDQKENTDQIINKTITALKAQEEHAHRLLCHNRTTGESAPSFTQLQKLVCTAKRILFPGYFDKEKCAENTSPKLENDINEFHKLAESLIFAGLYFESKRTELSIEGKRKRAASIALKLVDSLPQIKQHLITDVQAIYNGDPAAKSFEEIILSYPGVKAIVHYRIAHVLYKEGASIIPRMIAEVAHAETGIDIHPGAEIGNYFAIDHGTGVVIGETSIIGNNVKIYQGVTLGAKSFPVDENNNPIKDLPRHPILLDNVVVYAGATILGRITVCEGAIIGGNAWVIDNVAKGGICLKQ